MKNFTLLISLCLTCSFFKVQAQFELNTASTIRGLRLGAVCFTDFDADDDIDIFTFGQEYISATNSMADYTLIYTNDNLDFTENVLTTIPSISDGNLDWADYNNDGIMDMAVVGYSNSDGAPISRIYSYNGNFIDSGVVLPGISRGSIDWGDYNNDGQMDLLIVGQDNTSTSITKLFENQDGVFIEVDLPTVTGVSFGDAAWVDYDNDGLLDFMVSGVTGVAPSTGDPVTQLYRNTGTGFELVFDTVFTGVREGSIDWGDIDNDGDLDVLITGLTATSQNFTGLYLNDITGFTEASTGLPQLVDGFAKFGDYDNDGDLDILISGNEAYPGNYISKVFNNDALAFTEVFSGTGLLQSSGGWADFNNDGYLDFYVNG